MTFNTNIVGILIAVLVSAGLIAFAATSIERPPSQESAGDYERIYLSHGSIYAHKTGFAKTYNIVNGVLHVSREEYEDLVFFGTPEEAEAAGYKPSETFARDYTCWKEGKDWHECWPTPIHD